jgi:hypothetical protein
MSGQVSESQLPPERMAERSAHLAPVARDLQSCINMYQLETPRQRQIFQFFTGPSIRNNVGCRLPATPVNFSEAVRSAAVILLDDIALYRGGGSDVRAGRGHWMNE